MTKKSKESVHFHLASELGGLELLDAKYTHQNFSRHSHEGFTIGVIEKALKSSIEPEAIILRLKTALF